MGLQNGTATNMETAQHFKQIAYTENYNTFNFTYDDWESIWTEEFG